MLSSDQTLKLIPQGLPQHDRLRNRAHEESSIHAHGKPSMPMPVLKGGSVKMRHDPRAEKPGRPDEQAVTQHTDCGLRQHEIDDLGPSADQ